MVEMLCALILRCISGEYVDGILHSVDEKTGIQAIERKLIKGVKPGKLRKIEYEYIRHGTTCLIGAVDISKGKISCYRILPTRTEQDFVVFLDQLRNQVTIEKKITILLDQLNIHKSEG